jgi:hypothetical protein
MNNKSNFAVTIAYACASVLWCSDSIILFVWLCTSYLQQCLLRNCIWSRLWSKPYFHTLFSPWWLWWGNMISVVAHWRECDLDLEAWLKVFHLQNTTWLNEIIYPFYVTSVLMKPLLHSIRLSHCVLQLHTNTVFLFSFCRQEYT